MSDDLQSVTVRLERFHDGDGPAQGIEIVLPDDLDDPERERAYERGNQFVEDFMRDWVREDDQDA